MAKLSTKISEVKYARIDRKWSSAHEHGRSKHSQDARRALARAIRRDEARVIAAAMAETAPSAAELGLAIELFVLKLESAGTLDDNAAAPCPLELGCTECLACTGHRYPRSL